MRGRSKRWIAVKVAEYACWVTVVCQLAWIYMGQR